jgi:transposase
MAKRRKYSAACKREAVGLTRQPGATVSQVARDIGVTANQLFRWRRALEADDGAFRGAGVARDQELLALKRELAKVKRERRCSRSCELKPRQLLLPRRRQA